MLKFTNWICDAFCFQFFRAMSITFLVNTKTKQKTKNHSKIKTNSYENFKIMPTTYARSFSNSQLKVPTPAHGENPLYKQL